MAIQIISFYCSTGFRFNPLRNSADIRRNVYRLTVISIVRSDDVVVVGMIQRMSESSLALSKVGSHSGNSGNSGIFLANCEHRRFSCADFGLFAEA